jgi:outer membrane protein
VIGDIPDDLQPPPPLPPLPATANQAVDIALANNPDLIAIGRQIRAAGLDVNVLNAGRLPTVSAVGSSSYTNYLGTADEQFAPGAPGSRSAVGLGVRASVPLYQGGLVAARVRQGQAQQSQLLEQGIAVERSIVANTRAAFSSYRAAQEAIKSNEIAVAANSLALEGTRAELTVGTRNVLDVLNAEQELLNSQVQLVSARRDAYVAGFQLLNAMGMAEAEDLNLDGGPLYDPVVNYNRVARRKSDWSRDPAVTRSRPAPSRTRSSQPRDTAAPIGNSPRHGG